MKLSVFRNKNSIRLYLLFSLISLELLMSFSFLGYIHVEPISITFAYIPVLLAGAVLGIPDAVAVGLVFGLSSMWKAGASYVLPADQMFSPFMSGRPAESLLLSVGSRALFGLLVGVLYSLAKRVRFTWVWIGLISFFGKFLHSFLVYSCMGLLFPESGYHAANALKNIVGLSDLPTDLVTCLIVILFWRLEKSGTWQGFCLKIQKVQSREQGEHDHKLSIAAIVVLAVSFAMVVGMYFVNRMDQVLLQSGIALSDRNYADLLHLQIQFLIGILSIMMLVAVFLVFNRKYATYMTYEADTDGLTGLLTREAFFRACRKTLEDMKKDEEGSGYFLMVDVDRFKQVNDCYGHPQGDQILRIVARQMREVFEVYGQIGRLGGDEFAALLRLPVSNRRIETELEYFLKLVRENRMPEMPLLSCSIGVVHVDTDKSIDELYQEADRALYFAKEQGRGRYFISGGETLQTGHF